MKFIHEQETEELCMLILLSVKMRGEWIEYWLSEQELILDYCHILFYYTFLWRSSNKSVFALRHQPADHTFKISECVSWQILNKSTVAASRFLWVLKVVHHQLLPAACRMAGNFISLYYSHNVNQFHLFSLSDTANEMGEFYITALG